MARLRNYFFTGLVIAAPLVLTIYITWSLIQWIDSWVKPAIPPAYNPDNFLSFRVPGFGLVVALVALTLLGFLTANLVGRAVVSFGEDLLGRMPIVRVLYRGLKQLFETVLSNRTRSFQSVGLLEFPNKGMWVMVFVATQTRGEIAQRLSPEGDEMLTVFIPPTPAPTAGFLLFVKARDVIPLDMSVEDALKLVLSAGLVTPDYPRPLADSAAPADTEQAGSAPRRQI
jgi:uncharacterized membrane protein